MNLQHEQLQKSLNRTRRVPGPAMPGRKEHNIPQPPADPENPYRMTHVGMFRGSVYDEKGKERPYVFYIPSTMKTSGNSMLVFIPGGEKPEDFFRRNHWDLVLEKYAITTYFVSAPEGWDQENPGLEMDMATRVMEEMRSMEYFPCNAPGVYCMGFGDGARMAAVFSVIHVSVLAAWAAYGDTQLDESLLDWLGTAPSDCDGGIMRGQVPLPSFIIDDGESNVVRFFKKACRTKEEYLYNGFARVYRQQPKPGESYINDQACSEVWHGTYEDAQKLGEDTVIDKMTGFVEDYKRWGGEGNSHIRRTQRPEDIGLIRKEAVIDGLKRYWYVFEPTGYKRRMKEKYPLVIAIHGFSCSGEFFAENSGWHSVGEERGAIIVYPTAYPFERTVKNGGRFDGNIAVTPSWNSGFFSIETDPNGPDDLHFFKEMLEKLEAEYPVDPERIYVTGHSNGSMMTQRIMRYWPQKFAGFAPVGAMECREKAIPIPEDGYLRNVWYTIGEFDGAGCSMEEGTGNSITVRNLCDANNIDYEKRRCYESGIYMNTIVRDEKGVPLVRFTGVKNWPHTYSPELAFMIYDEFFARFVRHEDGTLEYLA